MSEFSGVERIPTFEPAALSPAGRSLKFGGLRRLRPGSILDWAIRLSNGLLGLRSAIAWFKFVSALARQHRLPAAPLDTFVRPFRAFAVHRLSVRERCSLLRAHYRRTIEVLPRKVFEAL